MLARTANRVNELRGVRLRPYTTAFPKPLVPIGQACDDFQACVEGAFCAVGLDGFSGAGTCSTPRENGELCDGANQCKSGFCDGVCGAPRVTSMDCALE